MESMKVNAYIGEDGILSLRLPIINQEIEVMVVYQPVKEKRQWSPNF